MSKAVLISIRPKWCELIANGKKTIEVRKSRPKLRTPFKCYIYCTKDRRLTFYRGKRYCYADDHAHNAFDVPCIGAIIGEFVCDSIDTYDDDTIFSFRHEDYARWNDFDLDRACIHPEDFQNYSGGKWLYGWHISGLKIYDTPRKLGEFSFPPELYCEKELCGGCPCDQVADVNGEYSYDCEWRRPLSRAPQSWCYVEELSDG